MSIGTRAKGKPGGSKSVRQPGTTKPAAVSAVPKSPTAPDSAESFEQYAERISMRFALVAAAISLFLVIILNWNRSPVPLQLDRRGFGSIAFYFTPIASAVFGSIGYVMGMREFNRRVAPRYQRKWEWGGLPVGIGMGLVAGFALALGLELTARAFRGLELVLVQAAFITAAVVGVLTHVIVTKSVLMTGARALQLAILSLVVGLYATATRMDNPEWWRIAFSHLGSMASSVFYLFTISLVLSAAIMAVWLSFVMRDVQVLIERGRATPFARNYFIGGILWLSIGIALVGLFPTQLGVISHWVHNLSAYSLALLFGLWFVFLQKALPNTSPEIKTLSVTVAIVLIVTLILAAIGYFNTVGLQVISFGIGITWLQAVVNYVGQEAERLEPDLNAV